MDDQDVMDLRRLVADDPAHLGLPDVAAIRRRGRMQHLRRRATTDARVLGTVAALSGPVVLAAGAWEGSRSSTAPAAENQADDGVVEGFEWPTPDCGVISCAGPDQTVQVEPVLAEVELGDMPGGGRDLLYVLEGVGFDAQEGQKVDVVATGYQRGGQLTRTAWAVNVDLSADREGTLWYQEGRLNGRPADDSGWVLVGWVPGAPERISWQTPDGHEGEAAAMLRRDGYTAFAAVLPFPEGYEPPPRRHLNPDGSMTVETAEGVEVRPALDLTSSTYPTEDFEERPLFAPDATVTTSDGWSCSLDECGTSG